ncbi:MAG: GNAT family N-acetyltransferase [Desulfobacteraceae bacterium]|nr:GNAT family N-acetyltransferase [Desulfobacteraceae bacterium]
MNIVTERLVLRLIQPEDLNPLLKLWTDPDVTCFLGGPREIENLKKDLLEDIEDPERYKYNVWPVFERKSSQLVGHCGIVDKEIEGRLEYDLVYVFFKEAWGQGYATEIAFALKAHAKCVFQLKRLVAVIEPDNLPSGRVAEKLGMRPETELLRPDGRIKKVFAVEL